VSQTAVLTSEARDDLRAELLWIGPENIAKAQALRDAIFLAARRLGERPLLGRREADLLPEPYRFWSLTRFQVVLVYNAGTVPPRILRILILSTARDFGPLLSTIAEPLPRPASVLCEANTTGRRPRMHAEEENKTTGRRRRRSAPNAGQSGEELGDKRLKV